MSERIPIPVDYQKSAWRTNPLSPNASTPPSAGKRADGWPFEAPFPHDEANFQFNLIGLLLSWLGNTVDRVFDDIVDALQDPTIPVPAPYQFTIQNWNSLFGSGWQWGSQIYGLTPPGFTSIEAAACDGGRDFWIDVDGGTVNIYAAKPDDGSQVWAISPADVSDNAIAADGNAVYLSGDGSNPGIVKLDRDSGAELDRQGTPIECFDIASNGGFAVMAGGSTTLTRLHYYNLSTAPIIEVGFTDTGGTVAACAIDRENAYFGGQRSGGFDVYSTKLSTMAYRWSITLPTVAAPTVTSVKTDGRLVYVGIKRTAMTAGGFANLFALEPRTGRIIWTLDAQAPGQTDGIDRLAVDGKQLFATTDAGAGLCLVIDITGEPAMIHSFSGVSQIFDADGISFLSTAGSGAAARLRFQTRATTFTVRQGNDPNRSPIHKLAVPVW